MRLVSCAQLLLSTDAPRLHSFHCRFCWGVAASFLGVFNVVQNLNIPLIIQPQLFCFLSIISWSQVSQQCQTISLFSYRYKSKCMYYGKGKSLKVSLSLLLCCLGLLFGFEWGMIAAIRVCSTIHYRAPSILRFCLAGSKARKQSTDSILWRHELDSSIPRLTVSSVISFTMREFPNST